MESRILQPCSLEKDKKKKKSRKRGTTEPEPQNNLLQCSSSADEEKKKKKKKKKKKETITEAPEPGQPRVLVRCSSPADEEEKKKSSKYGSLKPLINTVTKTTNNTTSITLITPHEDPNSHIDLYFCIRTDVNAFCWCNINPSNTSVHAPKPKPKPKSSSSSYNNDNLKKKYPPILLTPISEMPTTPPYFRVIPTHSSSSGKGKHKKKLVYALGGSRNGRSSKAFVCDFASTKPVWKELPPMPSQLHIFMGVASPLDGNVYAFGLMSRAQGDPLTAMGVVFNPSSTSWNQCPHPFGQHNGLYYSVNDYALIDTEDRSELCVFTSTIRRHTFNLTTAQWEHTLYARVPIDRFRLDDDYYVISSSVAVGHLIFKFLNEKLYALDSSSPEQSFQPVPGLDNKLPKHQELRQGGLLVYLGKGKLCIIWGGKTSPADKAPEGTISIICLKFWVGMCNRRNRLRAVIDRCERFVARGIMLHDVVAL